MVLCIISIFMIVFGVIIKAIIKIDDSMTDHTFRQYNNEQR